MTRLTIIGLGYTGTSLGLALKARQPKLEIVGHDLDAERAASARKLGAIDRSEWNLPAALERAALVIVATPLGALDKLFSEMAQHLPEGCVVTDTAPLKGPALAAAARHLPPGVSFVGGHPVARPDGSTTAPQASAFLGQAYCIVAAASTTDGAVSRVVQLAELVGAKPLILDASEHDAHAAGLDQLPSLVAGALMNLAAGRPSWRDAQRLAGARFGLLTSPALDSPAEQRVRLLANRELVLAYLEELQAELSALGGFLRAADAEGLQDRLDSAQHHRASWQPGAPPPPDFPRPELPGPRESLSSLFLGRRHKRGS